MWITICLLLFSCKVDSIWVKNYWIPIFGNFSQLNNNDDNNDNNKYSIIIYNTNTNFIKFHYNQKIIKINNFLLNKILKNIDIYICTVHFSNYYNNYNYLKNWFLRNWANNWNDRTHIFFFRSRTACIKRIKILIPSLGVSLVSQKVLFAIFALINKITKNLLITKNCRILVFNNFLLKFHQLYRKTARDKNCLFFSHKVLRIFSEFFNTVFSHVAKNN